MKTKIKIFGERNTGTRALANMLRKAHYVQMRLTDAADPHDNVEWAALQSAIQASYNHDWRKLYKEALRDNQHHKADPLKMWKHAAPEWHEAYVFEHVQVIFLVRNPYSWLISTAKKPYHMKAPRTPDFAEFLTRPWLTERRDNTKILLRNICELWNLKVKAYTEFAVQARLHDIYPRFILFEDFLADPAREVGQALESFHTSTSGVEALPFSTKRQEKSLEELQSYYAQEQWRQYLTDDTVAIINSQIDWGLAQTFGYASLDPAEFPSLSNSAIQKQFAYEMMNLDPRPEMPSHDTPATEKIAS